MRMITIRLSDEEHRAIAYQAASVNKSINSYILNTLGIPVATAGKLRGRKSKVLKQCKCGNPYDECICQDSSSSHLDTDTTDPQISE